MLQTSFQTKKNKVKLKDIYNKMSKIWIIPDDPEDDSELHQKKVQRTYGFSLPSEATTNGISIMYNDPRISYKIQNTNSQYANACTNACTNAVTHPLLVSDRMMTPNLNKYHQNIQESYKRFLNDSRSNGDQFQACYKKPTTNSNNDIYQFMRPTQPKDIFYAVTISKVFSDVKRIIPWGWAIKISGYERDDSNNSYLQKLYKEKRYEELEHIVRKQIENKEFHITKFGEKYEIRTSDRNIGIGSIITLEPQYQSSENDKCFGIIATNIQRVAYPSSILEKYALFIGHIIKISQKIKNDIRLKQKTQNVKESSFNGSLISPTATSTPLTLFGRPDPAEKTELKITTQNTSSINKSNEIICVNTSNNTDEKNATKKDVYNQKCVKNKHSAKKTTPKPQIKSISTVNTCRDVTGCFIKYHQDLLEYLRSVSSLWANVFCMIFADHSPCSCELCIEASNIWTLIVEWSRSYEHSVLLKLFFNECKTRAGDRQSPKVSDFRTPYDKDADKNDLKYVNEICEILRLYFEEINSSKNNKLIIQHHHQNYIMSSGT